MPIFHFVTNRAITLTNAPKIKTKSHTLKAPFKGFDAKILSRNQKKCNKIVQPNKKCRIFAFRVRKKKIVDVDSDL